MEFIGCTLGYSRSSCASARLYVMREQSMSGPEPSKTLSSAAGVLREQADDTKFAADLGDLAARFAAQSGGGLSAELSADLALEIVLNEIAEQACLATGATGAAIVLERSGEMVCRASSGPTAPELGSRLDTSSGLSGECCRTRQTQWCDDAKADPRVHAEASERLGMRSIIVMPLVRGSDLVGVIELFSSQPYAFGARDEQTLEVLARRTLNNLEDALKPLELQNATEAPTTLPELGPEEDVLEGDVPSVPSLPRDEPSRPAVQLVSSEVSAPENNVLIPEKPPVITLAALRRLGTAGWALGASALAGAVLLGLALGWQRGTETTATQAQPELTAPTSNPQTPEPIPDVPTPAPKRARSVSPAAPARTSDPQVPPGGLLVFDNGKEVFRMAPNAGAKTDHAVGVQPPSSVEPESVVGPSSTTAEGSLLQRVEPQYPEAARQQNIQGTVVLEAHINTAGAVQDVQMVSGPPLLAQAATEAVRQWKFRPRSVNGRPVEMQTRITLNFRLPQ